MHHFGVRTLKISYIGPGLWLLVLLALDLVSMILRGDGTESYPASLTMEVFCAGIHRVLRVSRSDATNASGKKSWGMPDHISDPKDDSTFQLLASLQVIIKPTQLSLT